MGLTMLYNTVFFFIFLDFLMLLYYYDKEEYDFFSLMESMFFAYNIAIHFPITIVNGVVIFKEITLEFVQMSQKRKGRNENLALGISEWIEWVTGAFWYVDQAYEVEK